MKLYIWKHKNSANRYWNFYPLSKCEKVGENGIDPIASHAFFKRKNAIKYLEEIGWEPSVRAYFELITVEVP